MLKSTMLVAGAALDAIRDKPHGTRHRVVMQGMSFEPADLTLARGDSVTFVNLGPADHTATAADGSFETGRLAAGESAVVTVEGAGDIAFFCRLHPRMRGVITAA